MYEMEFSDMPGLSEERPRAADLTALVSLLDPQVARVLDQSLEGTDISAEDAVTLLDASGLEYTATVMVADELRRRTVGDVATYVVNRNINFTNVCIKRCGFCAFSRDYRQEPDRPTQPLLQAPSSSAPVLRYYPVTSPQ